MRWTDRQRQVRSDRIAEALRECGVLWLVFANLDRLVDGPFTLGWSVANTAFGLVLWGIGIYIELKEVKRADS